MSLSPVGQTCPYCQFPIKPGETVLFCSACSLAHHQQCWQENGKCTTFGCGGYAIENPTPKDLRGEKRTNCIDLTMDDLICPKCGVGNGINAVFCSRCGTHLSEPQQVENHVFCRRCGKKKPSDNHPCTNCNLSMQSDLYAPSPQAATLYNQRVGIPTNIDNHMAFAILTTLFCCLPFGIVSIVYASQVNGKIQVGDYAGAISAANNAKTWCWASVGSGILVIIIALS